MVFLRDFSETNSTQSKATGAERQLNLLDLRKASSEREQALKIKPIEDTKKELNAEEKPSQTDKQKEDLAPNLPPKEIDKAALAQAMKEQEARVYPELSFSRKAMDVLSGVAGTAKEKWDQANALFHVAEIQVEKFIDLQGGIQKMFHKVSQLADELYNVMDNFVKGNRGLKTADGPEKPKQEADLREQIGKLNKSERLAAIRGEKGPALREGIFNICDDEEKDAFTEIDVALNKVQLHSSIKLQHALAANKYAMDNNDINAKILAENILKSIAAVDPDTYRNSPDLHGLILQSERGEPMDISEGKAFSTAMTAEAQKVIQMNLEGPDAAFDGEARKQGAEQAAKLLAAALASNRNVCKSVWETWEYAKKYQAIFSTAESMIAPSQIK